MKNLLTDFQQRIRRNSLNGIELIVGPQMWTVGFFLWMIVIGGIIHAFGAYDAKPDMVFERIVSVLAAHIPMMLTVYLSLWISRNFSPTRKLFTVVLGFYIGGALRGAVLQSLMIFFEASIFTDYPFRVFGSAINVTILGIALAYLMSVTNKWSELFSNLRTAQLKLEKLLSKTENEIDVVTNDDISAIKFELINHISTLNTVQPEVVSQQIKNLIDNNVRPLISAYLHPVEDFNSKLGIAPGTKFRWLSVVDRITTREAIRPVGAMIPLLLINIPSFNRYLGFSKGAAMLFLIASTTIIFFQLARKFASVWVDKLSAAKKLTAILIITGVFTLPSALLLGYFIKDEPVLVRLPLELPGIYMFESLFFGFWAAAQKELSSMEHRIVEYNQQIRWKIAELNGRLWHHRRKFARLLHGPIQAELSAFAIRIDRNSTNKLAEEFDQSDVHELATRVSDLMEKESPALDLKIVMDEISETWLDICAIEYSVTELASQALIRDHLCHEVVVETIREVSSNAIRHGGATEIKIHVDQVSDRTLGILITNNGVLKAKDSITTPGFGIGSLYIAECTISHAVEANNSGVISRSTVPIRL